MKKPEDVQTWFEWQAELCQNYDAPLTANVCLVLGQLLARNNQDFIPLTSYQFADILPLRLCGALHYCVRTGLAPELADLYASYEDVDMTTLRTGVEHVLIGNRELIADFLTATPQTNEVNRCCVLLGGFAEIRNTLGLPLDLLEIGASGGLNLFADRYQYDLGGQKWGNHVSKVRLQSQWSGRAPALPSSLAIQSRCGCDLNPLDISSTEQIERLLSYVWPEQLERVARVEAALAFVKKQNLKLEQADALLWLQQQFQKESPVRHTQVLYHSVFWSYLPKALADKLKRLIENRGRTATNDRPFAWLAYEGLDDMTAAELKLTIWPGGKTRVLAHCDFHGKAVNWLS